MRERTKERRTAIIRFCITKEERTLLEKQADAERRTLSQFVRLRLGLRP